MLYITMHPGERSVDGKYMCVIEMRSEYHRRSHYNYSWWNIVLFVYFELRSHYVALAGLEVAQADLRLVPVLLTLSGKCWYYRWAPPPWPACSHAEQENKTETQHHFQARNLGICKMECSETHGDVDVGLCMLWQVQLSLRTGCN